MSDDPRELDRRFDPAPFHVDPTLRGLPLASYGRRLTALLIDLGLIALLTQSGGLTLSTLLGIVTFWLCVRGATAGWWSRLWRGAVGLPVAFFVFLMALGLTWDGAHSVYGPNMGYGPSVDWGSFGADMASEDPEVQAAALARLDEELEKGFSDEALQESLKSFGVTWGADEEVEVEPLDRDETIRRLEAQLAALRGDDETEPATPEAVREALQTWVAGPELEAAKSERTRLIRRLGEMQKDHLALKEQLDNPSFKYTLQALASDLGLTMGWAGLYFTLFLALAAGRTPGKWIMGLRVARVDGSPLSAWSSFERFAGYAAGLATGMLGFLQIFWDRNGQTVQDTIAGTVVLDARALDARADDQATARNSKLHGPAETPDTEPESARLS